MNRCFSYSCWSSANLKNGMNRWLLYTIKINHDYIFHLLTSIWYDIWYHFWFWVYIRYSYLIELQTEWFTELNSQIGRIDGIGTTNSWNWLLIKNNMIWLIIMSIEHMRLNRLDWDRNRYWFEYYFIDCIHVTVVTR